MINDGRNKILDKGGISLINSLIKRMNNKAITEDCCMALSNICLTFPYPPVTKLKPAIKTLCDCLASGQLNDTEYFPYNISAIRVHVQRKEIIQLLIDCKVIPKII